MKDCGLVPMNSRVSAFDNRRGREGGSIGAKRGTGQLKGSACFEQRGTDPIRSNDRILSELLRSKEECECHWKERSLMNKVALRKLSTEPGLNMQWEVVWKCQPWQTQ